MIIKRLFLVFIVALLIILPLYLWENNWVFHFNEISLGILLGAFLSFFVSIILFIKNYGNFVVISVLLISVFDIVLFAFNIKKIITKSMTLKIYLMIFICLLIWLTLGIFSASFLLNPFTV